MYPVCGSGLVYCPLTDGCEVQCSVGLETSNLQHDSKYRCSKSDTFCSHEESCKSSVKRPDSFSGKVLPGQPVAYETLHTLRITTGNTKHGIPGGGDGHSYWRVTLPKYEDENRHGEITNRSVHTSFPMGSRIALRCVGKCPEIPWM